MQFWQSKKGSRNFHGPICRIITLKPFIFVFTFANTYSHIIILCKQKFEKDNKIDSSEEPRGIFLVIDNKSFYATVECTMRGLDPLTTPLVVMSEAENTNGGLVLASSPMAKKLYGISNVNRQRDLPRDNHLIVVPPRMNTYIEKNIEVNNIYREFVADEDLLPYSIDESILDITHSWKLFGDDPIEVVQKIQKTIHDRLKLVTTVGVGENPLQAKTALDVYAKHDPRFIGEITYDTVKDWNRFLYGKIK